MEEKKFFPEELKSVTLSFSFVEVLKADDAMFQPALHPRFNRSRRGWGDRETKQEDPMGSGKEFWSNLI